MKRLEVINRQLRNHLDMVRTFFEIRHERKPWDSQRQRNRKFQTSKFYVRHFISMYRDKLKQKNELMKD